MATSRYPNPTIHNLASRWLRDVRLTREPDGTEVVSVYFTSIQRQLQLCLQHDEVWRFRKGVFTVIHRHLRNGRLIREHCQAVAPLLSAFWTQKETGGWVMDRFNEEQTAQCIIEQYLYNHTPNPEGYRVVSFDFSKVPVLEADQPELATPKPIYSTRNIRPIETVMAAAQNDRSENADEWMRLFEAT